MLMLLKRVISEDRGQGMAEYALILAFIALVAMAAVGGIGTQLNAKFAEVAALYQ